MKLYYYIDEIWFYPIISTDIFRNAFQALKLFSHEKIYLEKLVKCAMLSLTLAGGDDCGTSVSSSIVGWYLQRGSMKRARKMYKRYANCCPRLECF
jgi:hypothetical protein